MHSFPKYGFQVFYVGSGWTGHITNIEFSSLFACAHWLWDDNCYGTKLLLIVLVDVLSNEDFENQGGGTHLCSLCCCRLVSAILCQPRCAHVLL